MKRPPTHRPWPRILDMLQIGAFLAVIAAPGLLLLARPGAQQNLTKFEAPVPAPTLSWKFPLDAQRYINAHFGLRDLLANLHAMWKLDLFGVSSSDKILLGKDGWLFYGGERIVDDFRRIDPFTEDELAVWTKILVTRRDWLRAQGIPFLFFVAPNQQTIYPEEMPDSAWHVDGPTRLDQLIAYLHAHTDIDVVDVRPQLLAAKAHDQVFYRTDSHWNQVGGYIAFREIEKWMAAHLPGWKPTPSDAYARVETPGWHGGLGPMMGAPWRFAETRIDLVPKTPRRVTSNGLPLPQDETTDAWTMRPRVVLESPDGEIPSAVFFRDSQLAAPSMFLAPHFLKSVLLWTRVFDPQAILQEHPKVVVVEFVERMLMLDPPADPPLP